MPQYTWIGYAAMRALLAQRLADPANHFWSDAECGAYLLEALQTWNALTGIWHADFVFTAPIIAHQIWYLLPTMPGSPRLRTMTDTDLYQMMEYHLLEPATGGTWTGTPQFSIADLSGALERRMDEIVQFTGCRMALLALPTLPTTRRNFLPDNVLDVRRARWIPDLGDNVTLWRNDSLGLQFFEPLYRQSIGPPVEYNVHDGPPLSFNVDQGPNTAGHYELVVNGESNFLNPPASTNLTIPPDWAWVAKWGAMSDLLGRDSEATDRLRAEYCLQRYREGLNLMQQSPWILYGAINNVPVDTASLYEMDAYATEWDSNPASYPAIVTAGIDMLAVSPVPSSSVGVSVTVVGNAPLPVLDTDFVQISFDDASAVLDYAQHIASFKMGGSEFTDTAELYKNFVNLAAATNSRIEELGIFHDLMWQQGLRQDENQARFKEPVK